VHSLSDYYFNLRFTLIMLDKNTVIIIDKHCYLYVKPGYSPVWTTAAYFINAIIVIDTIDIAFVLMALGNCSNEMYLGCFSTAFKRF